LKIGSSKPVGLSTKVGATSATRGAAKGAPVRSTAPVEDTTTVLGIPEVKFTPKVRAAIVALLKEVESLRGELEQSKARIGNLEKLADEDSLAPISNRRAFVRDLSRMLSFSQRYNSQISVLYFDINDMKHVNDTYGHAAGDAAITHVAAALTGAVRESDVVGRLGGDEFGVILANADEAAARTKAEQLAHAISSNPIDHNGKKISIEITFGVYSLQADDDASTMLEHADRAMYARKPRESQGTS
jgi:diguanylate cyclase (GGDEF)-like protein